MAHRLVEHVGRVRHALVAVLLLALVAVPAASSAGTTPFPAWASPAELDAFLQEQHRELHLPGLAVTVLLDGEVYLEATYGEAAPGGPPVTPDTPFVLGSTSKQFTGLAVQQLVADGRLALDTPVRTVLPELGGGAWSGVTVRHLLAHRSGLTEEDGLGQWGLGEVPGSIQEEVGRLAEVTPAAGPGERFEYSNANYDLLGAVVERVTGQSFESALQELVAAPLGLEATTTDLDLARERGLAAGHYTVLRRWNVEVPGPLPPGAAPSGFVTSTARDLTRLLQAHLDGGSGLDEAVLAAAREPLGEVVDQVDYGSGWFMLPFWELAEDPEARDEAQLPTVLEHHGDTTRSMSTIAMVPDHGLGVVVLANTGRGTHQTLQPRLWEELLHTLVGTPAPERDQDLLLAATPVLMVLLPLAQTGSLVWLVRTRSVRPGRSSGRTGRATVVVAGLLTAVASLLALEVVPARLEAGLLDTQWWLHAPDLAVSIALVLLLALATLAVLVGVAAGRLRRRGTDDAHPVPSAGR
ncbi:serine hydrolase domain-containing protein [Ornithinimicrobium sp. W1665]|uniref:serine hydrolase domain-containing protein n=1 Tax=Ornithinimicrobium sp. W1665 TaxID=3416666 RepID=UPI003CEC3236